MRAFLLSLGLASVVISSGCSYLPDRVTERFAPAPAQERVFAADRDQLFDATQTALRRMSFTVAKAAEAQGRILGRSPIARSEALHQNVQYEIEVEVREFGPGESKAAVWVREHVEGKLSGGGATIQPLKDHGLYVSFFAQLEQVLKDPAVAAR